MVPLLLPLPEAEEDFSLISTVGTWLSCNLTILGGPSEVFNSQTRPHGTSSNLSITVQVFLLWHWFPWKFLLVFLCSSKPWLPVSVGFLSSPTLWGAVFPYLSLSLMKSYWLFSLFSFLCVVRKEWWLLSFLYVEIKMQPSHLLKYFLFWVMITIIWLNFCNIN